MLTPAPATPDASMLSGLLAAARNKPAASTMPGDDERGQFLTIERLKKDFERYLGDKSDEIDEQRDSRRQYHGAQWTADEVRALKDRGQPPRFYNKIGRKIDGIVGISEKQRQDPKAYPRNPRDEDGADVATVVVREITERNEWTSKKPRALRQALIDGISGVEFRMVKGDHGDPDIEIHTVHTEDFFYDPASVEPNFTDARFMGLSKWMDVDEAVELFPDREDDIRDMIGSGASDSIPSDRDNRWSQKNGKRLRMVEHWYRSKGEWCWAFYIGSTVLDQGLSPYFDERGDTCCRFEMFSALIDHDGDRYGIVRNLKPIQQDINQRVSLLLRLALTRRLVMEEGAVEDVETARREWARPDGVVVIRPGKIMKPDDTQAQVAEHTALLELAMREMEAFYNINPAALAGSSKNLSGRAVNLLQAPGLAELVMLFINYRNWVIRCYRMSWNLAQRFWAAERWIRVTDDQGVAQFVQLNGLQLDQYGLPTIVNKVGALDVDIIMDEGPDVQNMMQDSLDVLSQFLGALPQGSIPMEVLIPLMPLPASVKKTWEGIIEKQQQPDPAKQQAQQLALQEQAFKNALTQAQTQKTVADTGKSHAGALSDLASAAHKGSEAHLNSAQIFAGGLQATNSAAPSAPQAPSPPPAPPQGPAQANVPPALNAPLTRLGPQLSLVPGASPGANAAFAGAPSPRPPVGMAMPGMTVPQPPPIPGARKAPDGHWYVHAPHPHGQFRRVVRG